MKIGGPIPFHVARAYDIAPKSPAATPVQPVERVNDTTAHSVSDKLETLVAAKVNTPIDFADDQPRAVSDRQVLQMYTRAADKVEAAVNIELGRTIDLQA